MYSIARPGLCKRWKKSLQPTCMAFLCLSLRNHLSLHSDKQKKMVIKKRICYTGLLLVAALMMLVAEAFPHHHHEQLFCVNADLETCEMPCDCHDGMHHRGDADNHGCTTSCVTHFTVAKTHVGTVHLSPLYTFYSLIYLPGYDWMCFMRSDRKETVVSCYVEKLHARCLIAQGGLRAPPFCV